MSKLFIVAALLLGALSTAALADFYIVKDTVTKTCVITQDANKPAEGVDGIAYKTKADAEKAMDANKKACGGTAE